MTYDIYLDESGSFTRSEQFSLIGGIIWKHDGNCDQSVVQSEIKAAVMNLFAQWQRAGIVQNLTDIHSTTNKAYLKTRALQSKKEIGLSKQLLSSNLLAQCQTLLIYEHASGIDNADYLYETLYFDMLKTLIQETTEQLRAGDENAVIRFHIPTRQIAVPNTDAEQIAFYRGLNLVKQIDAGAGVTRFSINQGMTFLQHAINNHVGVSLLSISYSCNDPDRIAPDMWGYYLADWVCCMLRGQIANTLSGVQFNHMDVTDAIQANSIAYSYASIIKNYNAERNGSNVPGWLEAYMAIYTRPNLVYYKDKMGDNCPFNSDLNIQSALAYIWEKYYTNARYTEAQSRYKVVRGLIPTDLDSLPAVEELDMQRLACFNHQGKYQDASNLFDTIIRQTNQNPNGHFCWRLVLLHIQSQIDVFNYEFAEEYLSDGVQNILTPPRLPGSIKKLGIAATVSDDMRVLAAKYYSQLGQVYSYMVRSEEAGTAFRSALDIFDSCDNCSANYNITVSHFLHSLVDINSFTDEFAVLAQRYFGGGIAPISEDDLLNPDIWTRWANHIMADETQVNVYALFVYLKALYKFCRAVIPGDCFHAMIADVLTRTNVYTFRATHPVQLLHKYRFLLANLINSSDQKTRYYNKLRNTFRDSTGLIRLIWLCCKAECLHVRGNEGELNNLKNDALQVVDGMIKAAATQTRGALQQKRSLIEAITDMKDFNNVITYSYR